MFIDDVFKHKVDSSYNENRNDKISPKIVSSCFLSSCHKKGNDDYQYSYENIIPHYCPVKNRYTSFPFTNRKRERTTKKPKI